MTKEASSGKNRAGKSRRRKPAEGGLGSAVAAGASIVLLLLLLYASFRSTGPAPQPEPQSAAAVPTQQAPAVQAAQPAPAAKPQGENWNDNQIAWHAYDEGISLAKTENKPVCLVFFTNWCPHCRNFSRVFADPRIVARAKDFVMIRLNADDAPEISSKHSPDGTYVPRTFFLAPDGKHLADVHAPRPQYVHFYDESNPASLLAGMEAALQKTRAM